MIMVVSITISAGVDCVMVWFQPTEDYQPDSDELLAFPRKNGIRDATLLLLKEKSGRYGLLRVTYIISSHLLLLSQLEK